MSDAEPTSKRFSIDTLTLLGMPPIEHVRLAADLGCGYIATGLSPLPWKLDDFPAWSLRDNAGLRQELTAVMRAGGVCISHGDGFSARPDIDAKDYAADLDIFAELGAKRACGVCMERDLSRALDQIALLAEMTEARGMGFMLEFAPPHAINTLSQAHAAIRKIAKPNLSLVIDAMHFFRSGATIAELGDIDARLIGHVQLCDVPLVSASEDYFQEACFDRRIPGEGELPLQDFLAALPRDVTIGLEIPALSAVKSGASLRTIVERSLHAGLRLLDER